ncbi:LLM class flavin-dependent oxidoreductase [Paenibacillus frigoriresistens]|nr:LLM class flavin-dependent oxidoreductase [Paenibacillus frigoriresistens]NRF94393.1 LLM class flavin-dependent oxidoreductase [Paenibacillus frigoriresistens]
MTKLEFSTWDILNWPHKGVPVEGELQTKVYQDHMEEWVYAEEQGFDAVWLTEHHFTDYNLLPSPNIMLAALTQKTNKIKIGNMINALNFNDPWRLAEEFAMLDVLSNGRLLIGLGRSADILEYDKYGMPMSEGRPRFQEGLNLIKKAFTEDVVNFDGEFYRMLGGSLVPRPLQKPYPTIYTTVLSPESFSWAAKEGLPISSIFLPTITMAEKFKFYMSECEKFGREPDPKNFLVCRHVYVADSKEQAIEDAKEPMLDFLRLFRSHAVPAKQEQLATFPENFKYFTQFYAPFFGGALTYESFIESGMLIVGDPESVVDQIQSQQQEIGLSHLMCGMSFGNLSHDKVMNSMKLFGEKVMPNFK